MTGELPQSLTANPRLSTWFTAHGDGTFDLHAGKVELGQGITTALVQIAARELCVAPMSIRFIATNTGQSPDEGLTAGSLSITTSGAAVRRAAAEVRHLFLRAAAAATGRTALEIRVVDGLFLDLDGTVLTSYAELACEVDLDVDAGDESLDVEFADKTSGPDLPRIDLPDKVFGHPRFLHDLSFEGMVHARVVRPPRPGAHLEGLDVSAVESLPGVIRVVREGDFLAVVAEREGQSVRAAEALATTASWTGGLALPDSSDIPGWLRTQPAETLQVRHGGAVHGRSPATLTSTYSKPYVAHGSIGPSCAIARHDGAGLRVWSHSQGVFSLGATLSKAFDIEDVVVQHVEGSGSYGHNSADDAAFDAALIAMRMPGRHVRVQWSRADELAWEPFGPAMVGDVTATLDNGRITDWTYDVWSNGHTARPGYAVNGMLGEAHRAGLDELPPAVDPPAARGFGGARNADPYYDIPRVDVTGHRLLTMPLRVSSLRSLGAHLNSFALESFLDELAHSAGQDPLAFRLQHLSDPRARDVLSVAAEAAGWGAQREEDTGLGIAFSRYKNRGSYCAVVAEVEVTDHVRVRKLTIAVDVGRVVNGDGVRNQIEGGAIQTTSWSLLERVLFDHERVTSTDWESYPILRFSDVPHVDVHLISRPAEPTLGAGEATQGPVPAAIGNAIFDAIGVRVRSLPFTPQSIVSAIEAEH